MIKRKLSLFLGLLLTGALLTSCGTGPAATPSGTPAGAKIFHTFTSDNPPTFDPAMIEDASTYQYLIQQVYAGLVGFDAQGKIRNEMAADYKVSSDGLTYTFTLKDGLKFSNGDPVTAEDFRWSIVRAANPALASGVWDSYLNDITGLARFADASGKITGDVSKLKAKVTAKEADVKAGKAQQSELDALKAQLDTVQKKADADLAAAYAELQKNPGIDTPDPKTVVFHLNGPKPFFLAKLTYPTAFPVDRKVAPADKPISTSPDNVKLTVGTGPFVLSQFTDNSSFVLKPNPNYQGARPKVDEVDIQVIKDSANALVKYKAGELDTIHDVSATDYPTVKADPVLSKELAESPLASVQYIAINPNGWAPAKDPSVRRALAMALDKNALLHVVWNDTLVLGNGYLPPGVPGGLIDKLTNVPKFDPAGAKALLKQAGFDPLPPFKITYRTGAAINQQVAEFLQSQFQTNLGVKVDLEPMEWGAMLRKIQSKQDVQVYRLGWSADYLDPQDFLSVLLHCGVSYNWSGYCNKDVDSILDKADMAPPGDARFAMYGQAEQKLVDDTAWIPLGFQKNIFLNKPYVKGVGVNVMGAMPFNTVEIQPH